MIITRSSPRTMSCAVKPSIPYWFVTEQVKFPASDGLMFLIFSDDESSSWLIFTLSSPSNGMPFLNHLKCKGRLPSTEQIMPTLPLSLKSEGNSNGTILGGAEIELINTNSKG